MRLVQFWWPREGMRVGVVDTDGMVRDVTDPARGIDSSLTVLHRHAGGERMDWLDGPVRANLAELNVAGDASRPHLLIPLTPPEVWGVGVTYKRSAEFRDEDAESSPGIYDLVYRAARPELFFKATPSRCVGPNEPVAVRSDSTFTAVEPELAIVVAGSGELLGYTICNDVSAWDIERENPLYLPQSKVYAACCALGPVLVTADEVPDPKTLRIWCKVHRGDAVPFEGETTIAQMKRSFDELIHYLRLDNPIPTGTVLSTGTGIIQPVGFSLQEGDLVEIGIDGIGVLRNPVRQL